MKGEPVFGCPKPEATIKERKPLRAKGGSRFPHMRTEGYGKTVTETYPCILFGTITRAKVTINDVERPDPERSRLLWLHRCQGPLTPMHVFKTQARGAGDVAEIVCGCWGTHLRYDQDWTKSEFARYTGVTEKQLQTRAVEIAHELGWVKRSGVWVHHEGD